MPQLLEQVDAEPPDDTVDVAGVRKVGAAFVLGKILNAFLLDHVQHDIEMLTRINALLDDGEQAFGAGFLPAVNRLATERGTPDYRHVETLYIRPSQDIGTLAAQHVRSGKLRGGAMLARRLLTLVDVGEAGEADLASYLLFDGTFARKLIELGRADAEARRHDVEAFFGSASEDAPPKPSQSGEWSIPPPVE